MSLYTFVPGGGGGGPVVPPGDQSYFADLGTLNQAVVKAAAGRVFSVLVENVTGPTKWLQLHNLAGVVPPAAVPRFTVKVPANAVVIVGSDFFGIPLATPAALLGGLPFSVGIAWAWSTTGPTFTAAVAAQQSTSILFL